MNTSTTNPSALTQVAVYLITDRNVVPEGRTLADQLRMALECVPVGSVAVQLREKDLDTRSTIALCRELATICRDHGAPLLVNSRADIALLTGVGLHLPSDGLPARLVRDALQISPIATSTHSEMEVKAAAMAGIDLVTFGPVYPTPSKLQYGPPIGPERLAGAREAIFNGVRERGHNEAGCLPPPLLVALGGITNAAQAAQSIRMGADAVACIRAVMAAKDPGNILLDLVNVVLENRQQDSVTY